MKNACSLTQVLDDIASYRDELVALRRDLHAHPETAFEEFRTADIVAKALAGWGIEVHRGLAGTGVVGVLRRGQGSRSIGLRADMDALHLEEQQGRAHGSVVPGKMHGCGHDGHVAMLLGAARYLSAAHDFDGTVHFVFQPAEEGEGGGKRMVEEGLFERFPMDAIYGLHNQPGMAAGSFGVRAGPMMASFDYLEITIQGTGGHGAFPHTTRDPILAAARVIEALQGIVSRRLNPLDSAVLSVTTVHAGETHNVIPDLAKLTGTVRTFRPQVRDQIAEELRHIAAGLGAAHGVKIDAKLESRYPPTVNTKQEAELAARAAQALVGEARVDTELLPMMAAEDFGFMLQARPGAYAWIGNGIGSAGGCMVHNPAYDFNDEILAIGSAYWVSLVRTALPLDTRSNA